MISNGVHVIIYIESFKHPFFIQLTVKKNIVNFFYRTYLFLSHWCEEKGTDASFLHQIKNISENENML